MFDRSLFTSESVTEGHPDKVADAISDAVLDALLTEDPKSRVACETLVTTGLAVIAGEITTSAYVHLPEVVREGEDVQLRIIKIDPQRHRLGLSLRQAEETGDFANGGAYEAWDRGTSYSLGGSGSATETADGEADESETGELREPVDERIDEPADQAEPERQSV